MGTFYRAPSPGAKPFVSEGQPVSSGETLVEGLLLVVGRGQRSVLWKGERLALAIQLNDEGLLQTAHDDALFEYYATSQPIIVDGKQVGTLLPPASDELTEAHRVLTGPAELPGEDDRQNYSDASGVPVENMTNSDFIKGGRWDGVDEALRGVYEEASEVVGREFPYPGDE